MLPLLFGVKLIGGEYSVISGYSFLVLFLRGVRVSYDLVADCRFAVASGEKALHLAVASSNGASLCCRFERNGTPLYCRFERFGISLCCRFERNGASLC